MRSMYYLEEHYHGHQNERMRGAYLPHIYEIMAIVKPLHLSYPHLIPKDKIEIYNWASAMYETWLRHKAGDKKERIDDGNI